MNVIKLDNQFLTGISAIDEEHRKIVDSINALARRIMSCKNVAEEREFTEHALDTLTEACHSHLKYEEYLMSHYDYPSTVAHLREHDQLRRELNLFRARHRSGEASLSYDVFSLIKKWLEQHIAVHDMQLASFIQSLEIQTAPSTAHKESL